MRWNDRPTTHLETTELRAATIREAQHARELMLEAVAAIRPASLEPPTLVGVRYVPPDPIDTTSDSDSEYDLEVDDYDEAYDDELPSSSEEDDDPTRVTGRSWQHPRRVGAPDPMILSITDRLGLGGVLWNHP